MFFFARTSETSEPDLSGLVSSQLSWCGSCFIIGQMIDLMLGLLGQQVSHLRIQTEPTVLAGSRFSWCGDDWVNEQRILFMSDLLGQRVVNITTHLELVVIVGSGLSWSGAGVIIMELLSLFLQIFIRFLDILIQILYRIADTVILFLSCLTLRQSVTLFVVGRRICFSPQYGKWW